MTEEKEKETRVRKLTEKGLLHVLEVTSRNVQGIYKSLRKDTDEIRNELLDGAVSKDHIEAVRKKYRQWLEKYDVLYEAREEYIIHLTEPELAEFKKKCESQDILLTEFKSSVENYFLKFGEIQRSESQKSVISSLKSKQTGSKGSRKSCTSTLSAQLEEIQKRIELHAKVNALKEREKLQIEKLKVQLKEEELEIQTQLEISEAKSKMLNELDEHNSVSNSGLSNFVPRRSEERKTVRGGAQFIDSGESRYEDQGEQARQANTEVSDVFNSFIRQLKKPAADIQKFSGDPIQFPKFLRQFQTRIIAHTDSDDERMSYLEQFTTDKARKIVSGYSFLPASKGYIAAMEELQRRYGDEDSLATALIGRALKWPDIKFDDAKMLDEFGIFLSECENAVKSIPAVKILEYPDNLRRLVMKLPQRYHERWRTTVSHVKDNGRRADFSDFVRFVKGEAKKANDPLYGREALQVSSRQTNTQRSSFGNKRHSNSSFSTSTALTKQNPQSSPGKLPQDKVCIYCQKQGHTVDSCRDLFSKPHEDRLSFIRNNSLCFRCFTPGHASRSCTSIVKCKECQGNHQTLLHMEKDKKQISAHANLDGNDNLLEAGEIESTLAIIPVCVSRKDGLKICTTYAFLDPGSTMSFCSETLLRKLGCSGKKVEITIDTMGKPHTSTVQAVNGLQVHDLTGENSISLPTLYSRDSLPVTSRHIPTSDDVTQWSHLSDLYIPQIDSDIDILIGCNVPEAYSPLEVRTGPKGSPHATRTSLGWILWNVMRTTHGEHIYPVFRTEIKFINEVEEIKTLNKLVQESVHYDFPEKAINDKRELSQEDKRFLQIVSDSISLQDGYYNIKLPFKQDDVVMPNNQSQALKRLTCLKRKFGQDRHFHEDYKTFMSDIISKQYAEEVPCGELKGKVGKQWYIPHHAVYHQKKPDKIRVVFDCAATFQGVSLNNVLLQGPDLTSPLISILLRFREESVAVIADIESMYYRVRVPPEDCDFLRFFWWPDGNYNEEPKMYRMRVHLFGAVSSASCASYALQQTARDNSSQYEPEIVQMLTSSFYVDDYLVSKQTEEKAIQVVKNITSLCKQGNFRLTKWVSNSLKVIKSVPEDERAKCIKQLNLDYDKLPSERALGVFWSVEEDILSFNIIESDMPNTRRSILSLVSKVYDPLGIVSPFVLQAKILLQDLCTKYDWDEIIDERSVKLWTGWQSSLPKLKDIQLNRCYKPRKFGNVISNSLHAFSDASDVGYGVVVYLRQVNKNGEIHCSFVMAKSRVAPVKKATVPRMELSAAAVSVRLVHMIKKELGITSVAFWTDSVSVLRYIGNETARFKTFVANRVNLIREGSEVTEWHYVQSSSNPADHASRGMKIEKLLSTQVWLHGPDFLWQIGNTWPQSPVDLDTIPESDTEVKKPLSAALIDSTKSNPQGIELLLNYYSSWTKLKKAVGWFLIFMKFLQQKKTKGISTRSAHKPKPSLTVQVLEEAENILIRHGQMQYFERELKVLEREDARISKSSSLYRLNPFLKNQLIRVGGRLTNSSLNFDAKHQIIIPKESQIAKLILVETHRYVGHLGKNAMLSMLRQKYWIPGANAAIRSLVSKCVICRRYQASPCQQKMADLPEDRVMSNIPPFSQVGMDYFGPFIVKHGRSSVKRYGVIFTCLNIRAVHLELASSLDTDSCVNAIRRFVARRGPPTLIRSDNGTNFVSSKRELKEEFLKMDTARIKNIMLNKGIEWIFNPPGASHFGGVWERMIRSVRKILTSLMNEQIIKLDDEGLYTLLCEAEAILNGRPLTEVSSDSNDTFPLTPNHLLLCRTGEQVPPGLFSKDDQYSRRRWRQIQYLADLFWKRFVKEYLPMLQERQRWTVKRRNLEVGDIVLLADQSPRNCWTLGKVTETMTDRKGYVRVVKVKTAFSELTRPVDKLCLIMSK